MSMTDNAALNSIAIELQGIGDFLVGKYDSVAGDTGWRSVSDSPAVARAADPHAIKTTVTNKGPNPVRVFENDILVLIVPVSKTEALPLDGAGIIKWECGTGLASQAALATYRKTV